MKTQQLFHDRLRGADALLKGCWRMMRMALVASILTGNLTLAALAWLWVAVGARGLA